MNRAIKNESGAVAIVVALMMVILLGFSAIVIDYGNIAYNKRALQNAADAACLAAAQELPGNTSAAEDAAVKYMAANAPDALLKSVVFSNDNKKVTISAAIETKHIMARAFVNEDGKTITAQASAITTTALGSYDYALFSGSEIDLLQFTGQNYIKGDVHSNNGVKNSATIDGIITASGTIDGKVNATKKITGYNNLAMPDFTKVKSQALSIDQATLLEAGATYMHNSYTMSPDQINALKARYPNKLVYIDGSVTINGSGVCTTGGLITSGDITFNGSGVDMASGSVMCLASLNGSITFNGGGGAFNGILFAPKGSITFDGKLDEVNGSVIANVVNSNGGLSVYYNKDADTSLPDTEIMLVE